MSGVEKKENISVINAYENNLKGISVDIPIGAFTCVTGPSGCGKSSLVFDTIYAESQRNFLESMSGNLYGQKLMDKPKVERIDNLKPALNVSQNYYNVNPRSTVGTVTDISYYLRTLYALVYSQEENISVDMNYFSANNPSSCCERCEGTGEEFTVIEDLVIPDKSKTLSNGGILFFKGSKTSLEYKTLLALCDYKGIDINKSVKDLTRSEREFLLYRKDDIVLPLKYKTPSGKYRSKSIRIKGAMQELYEKAEKADKPSIYASISRFLGKKECSVCNGKKLRKRILDFRICEMNISDVEELPLSKIGGWCSAVKKKYKKKTYSCQMIQLVEDISHRVNLLVELSLGYLSLDRSIPSLSGGEVQRIRIASQLGCSLNGIVYILDEPCKGLHYKNVDSIINATHELIYKGNTVVAIEHNKRFISEADKIIEIGPCGGKDGGYLISSESPRKRYKISIKTKPKKIFTDFFHVEDIKYHNLNGIAVNIPIAGITCVTGVSGAGKSSLVSVVAQSYSKGIPLNCRKITSQNKIKHVLQVDQQPIGKTPRSTVVSYLGIYDLIRDMFAGLDISEKKGLSASHFSMNVSGGRCEECQGTGKKKIEFQYLAESFIECPACKGKRFSNDVLEVKYNGYNINDVLNMSIDDAIDVLEGNEKIVLMLKCMIEIGLGYLSLGQMSMNLSGGEAQRIKLAKALGSKSNSNAMYFLDEPSSGLNEKDIDMLAHILLYLVDNGETIIMVEHNIEFIAKVADYIIDLGSYAGENGGNTVFEGYLQDIIKNKDSSWYEYRNMIK